MNDLQNPNIISDVAIKGDAAAGLPEVQSVCEAMSKSLDLPEDFDYQPASIAKVAMAPNDTHPNLIKACRDLLVGALPDDKLAVFDNHFLITTAGGLSLLAQRTALNSFWHVQFALLGTDGYAARQLLTSSGDDQEWLKWFAQIPLDTILKYDLPK